MQDQSEPRPDTGTGHSAAHAPRCRLAALVGRLRTRLQAWREGWEAASTYDHLRGLSDNDLKRRGLSRHSLAHDINNGHPNPKE